MDTRSFAHYLSNLDEASLIAVLQSRPDVRTQPVPRGFEQLAQRLGGADSLIAALRTMNRDAVVVGQVVAALGDRATVAELVRLLSAPESLVRVGIADLLGRGLGWEHDGVLHLPERLAAHWSAEIGGGRPVAKIARQVLAEDLRAVAAALGVAADNLRKPELIARIGEAMADARSLATVLAGLPKPARDRLDELRRGEFGAYFGYGGRRPRGADPTEQLVTAGLVLRVYGQPELPREVAVAGWLAESGARLTGRPDIPAAATNATAVRDTARAAVHDALQATAALLDEARTTPIAALKKGGVGQRERVRLARRLAIADDALVLWIDLTYAAGLLGRTDAGYAPTEAYPSWRDAEPAMRWAVLAAAWFWLEHAPTSREIEDGDKELPPPLPLASLAGPMRRALLSAARSGTSVSAVGRHIDWFFPLHGYDDAQRADKVRAAVREAELLGVAAADVLSEAGEHLMDAATTTDPVTELVARCAALLPEASCGVIVQSDLTAVVSGQPTVAVSRLLTAAAVAETRGAAGIWRFTPASIRAALDSGWTADGLLAKLKAVSDRPVPQPLEYLITDAARRHGTVRVRGMRSCIVAGEALVTEILHTRTLAKLHLSQLAPTVLSSPFDLDEVLSRLRAAGLSPVAEDALGAVIIEERREHRATAPERAPATKPSTRLTAAELAAELAADPYGKTAADSDTYERLALLNRHLDDAELALLTDAVINHNDVLIAYRDRNGSRSVRQIRPQQIYGPWLDSWCHLRNAQRDFTVANIESVAPARR